MSIPPTIQTQTDIDYNSWSQFEFLTFNYKGDAQYYSTEDLRGLTSGILPVVVYPSISPYDKKNQWTPFFITEKGTGQMPDIDPTKPYNGGECPKNWIDFSSIINNSLENFDYHKHGNGSLLPQSKYIQNSIKNQPGKTVSLFCALYNSEKPDRYITEIVISNNLKFYVLNVQNGDLSIEIPPYIPTY
jgi:hypothetical protein